MTGAILDIVNNTFRKREQLILIVFLLMKFQIQELKIYLGNKYIEMV